MAMNLKTKTLCTSLKALVACALLVGLQASVQAAPQVGVFQGKTFGEWSGSWWQWAFSFPEGFPNGEPFGSGVVDCAAGQSGPVWFLAGTGVATGEPLPGPGQPLERTCRNPIPTGVALFFPLLNSAMYNPDPLCGESETCTVPQKRVITDEIFSDMIPGPFNSQACKLKASLDGQPVQFSDYPMGVTLKLSVMRVAGVEMARRSRAA